MRRDCKSISLKKLCGLFGKTRHAYYDKEWQLEETTIEHAVILKLVSDQRKIMPRIGTPKLYNILSSTLEKHNIKIGRDKLHDVLYSYGFTVKKKRRRKINTTMSKHWLKKYPNLIRELEVINPEEVWVSDITYICLNDGFSYLSLITDAYSRKIVGHCLSSTLSHQGPLEALSLALSNRCYPGSKLIHHSDRGIQYCCGEYIGLLKENAIGISMTENSDPYENAIAERVNGILKEEFLFDKGFSTYQDARQIIEESIRIYNDHRPHASCDFLTPNQAHLQTGKLRKRWKTYFKARPEEKLSTIHSY